MHSPLSPGARCSPARLMVLVVSTSAARSLQSVGKYTREWLTSSAMARWIQAGPRVLLMRFVRFR